ncbi:hypothetical protein MTX35_22125 [Rhodococcus sp. ARC_M12]|uniref:hypothetical protein n=1 Tax=Rhodococcus sp. ARC_M12 TaxID=2928854 RepID=UPI001FB25F85|nr:hypothetical protein [Rhodococcus sp. ARC_M12]MCJ0980412.1 hypothetical protein [Rhodococcus sp. ARC_M12]
MRGTPKLAGNVTAAFEGVITLDGLDGRDVLRVGLVDFDRIELVFLTDEGRSMYPIAWDDAEHLAALLLDFAQIARAKHGLIGIEAA